MNTQNKTLAELQKLCECAIFIALAIVLDYLSKLVFAFLEPLWPAGGGISLCMIPMVFIAYRHGNVYGLVSGLAYSGLQIISGWYTPPAGTWWAILLCILLDYVIAYTVLGCSNYFFELFGKVFKNKLFCYGAGAFTVCMIRFVCSFLSGAILWGSYGMAWDGFSSIWIYSFVYNISYMLPNAIITGGLISALCAVFNPKTLKRYPKEEN